MSRGIPLSPKHGLNPAIPLCFFCLERKNELLLLGRLKGEDREAPKDAVFDRQPCTKCAGYMKQGIILISVRDGEEGDNPYRTGGWVVLTEEAVRRIIPEQAIADEICQKRIAFVPDEVWNTIGLPRGPVPDVPQT